MSKMDDCTSVYLPPGFRFHPTDEEIITHHLVEKIKDLSFSAIAIGEADLNKSEPWDLPGLATMGEKEWYFFCERDRKYPTGMRTNRATKSGYWKATGKDKEIFKGKGCLVGMKKTLVFYKGRAPKGEKTNWVMHEYRLEDKFSYWNIPKSAKDKWVVCRVFLKNTGLKRNPDLDIFNTSTYSDDVSESTNLPPLMDSSPYFINTTNIPNSTFTNVNNSNSHGEHFHGFHAGASTSTQSYISHMGLTTNVYDNSMNYYQPSYCKMEQYSNQTSSAMSTSPESSSVVSLQELGTNNNDYAHGQQNHVDFDYLLMNRYR